MQFTTPAGLLEPGAGSRLRVLVGLGALTLVGATLSPVRLGIVCGRSMDPTLHPGQVFFFTPRLASEAPLRHGDVVVVRVGRERYVKRILARGGEHFWALGRGNDRLTGCRLLTVNTPAGPWLRRFRNLQGRRIDVPAGHLFVVGDNPSSEDSRTYGPVPMDQVVGKVILPGADPKEGLSLAAWTEMPPSPRPLTRHARANGA